MLLERLSIENYGVYAGRSVVDLSSTKKKPLILIGGLNGAGKTTIFECIMIALYGRAHLGRRTTRKEYTEFIASRMHNRKGRRAEHASVEITFRFYHNGCEDEYVVSRRWSANGASVSESFSVYKNDSPMTDVDESQWQAFIEGLIPLGIARLFFFDGEKITRITKWNKQNNDEIRSSLDMLLGTELISQLHSDLDLYLLRKAGIKNSDMIRQKYEQLNQEKKSLSSEIGELDAEHSVRERKIEEVTAKISLLEEKVRGVGGGYAEIRGNLLTQKAVLEEKTRHQKKNIIEDLSEDAPLYLATSLLGRIKRQVEEDVDTVHQRYFSHVVKERIHELKKEIQSERFWPSGIDVKSASSTILERLDRLFEEPKGDVLFDVAPNDAVRIIQQIAGIQQYQETLLLKIKEYDDTMVRFEKIESEIAKIPRDDEIGPHISEINQMYEELGLLKSEITHVEQTIASKRAHQKILQNRLKGVIDTIHRNTTTNSGMSLASKMQNVLDSYSASLKERKLRELESNLLETARLLLHKKFIHRIEIDRETFEIRAYSAEDVQIPGGLLSMGERQIVGTALMWAIARTTGRSLPFVIDTPLGRLDGMHLANLVNRFYPFASHQTILLSTDREIGHKEYQKLARYISRSYRITHNDAKSATTITDGYFAEEQIA